MIVKRERQILVWRTTNPVENELPSIWELDRQPPIIGAESVYRVLKNQLEILAAQNEKIN